MILDDLTRESVLEAVQEYDDLGQEAFLAKYHFRPARDWVLVQGGRSYDSKAIAGAAYGNVHRDRGPLRSNEFVSGRQTVVRVLRRLGFDLEQVRPDAPDRLRVWVIRAGREGAQEDLALDNDVVLIGWSELGELSGALSREDLKRLVRGLTGEEREQSIAAQAGQIYRFINDVRVGDLVVLPLRTRLNHVAIGRVLGEYRHRTDGQFENSDGQHTRDIEWLARSLPYERFDPDLREAFGQQGTVSEITKTDVLARMMEVLEGADASAIHLVLKWSPDRRGRADTIERHLEVAEREGEVWWGRVSTPGRTGLAADRLQRIREQLASGSKTNVYLHSRLSTWRTRLVAITIDEDDLEQDLIPSYYSADTHHSLWVKLTDFEQIDPSELTEDFVLAQSGEPVTAASLGNQGPLIVRRRSATLPARYFILNQGAGDHGGYDDQEGVAYHWTDRSSGAWKQLANSQGARFVYYRPGTAADGTSQTYFGTGVIRVIRADVRDGVQHFVADVDEFRPFGSPVAWKDGPTRNAQTSIQPIPRAQFERLLAEGLNDDVAVPFDIAAVQAAADRRGLNLPDDLYAHLVAVLNSGKHVILTGPPGTAKTTLAQALADAAVDAELCKGYLLTTATGDWTTFETIGGLRPTLEGVLEFSEGQFLTAIRSDRWLVIDELNRSNFDRAFGQLFTVLSGQPVVLPYERPNSGGKPLTLVPAGATAPNIDADFLEIPQSWRIIATMNVFDKSLLFEMSFALMRRFAFVEVASPSLAVFEGLIDREAGGEKAPADLAKRLLDLRTLKDLGPAVFMDLARFLRERMADGEAEEDGELLYEAFYSYLLPQFEGIDEPTGSALFKQLAPLVTSSRRERLRTTLNDVLGLELEPRASTVAESEEDYLRDIEADEG